MKRILIVRMGAMGDIVHTLPAAATLRRAFPGAELDWVVETHWTALLERNPHVAQLHRVETREWRRSLGEAGTWRSLAESLAALRRREYDCALDFQGLIKSAALARLSGAPRVLGFDTPELREPLCGVLYTARVPRAPNGRVAHVVHRNLALAAATGAREPVLEFPLIPSAADAERARAMVKDVPGFVLVSPSAGWVAKRWPEESYAELAARIAHDEGRPVVVNCGPGEEEIAGRVVELAAAARPRLLCPTVGELMALVGEAAVVVGGDTGPLHLAAARGTPVVAVFGPTDPARNGPFGPATRPHRARVVRAEAAPTNYSRAAGREAIALVAVEQVFAAVRELLG